ncbi:MAG: DUF1015 domain-containing protein [Dehalococcoidia bacterium]|nr:DUF1015 domain-containing protein [Dehalococcoidia bacterium]
MPEIRPFRGVRYNTEMVKDLSSVLSPPYDVVSPQEREAMIQANPHNIISIEAPSDGGRSRGEPYQRAAAYFREWLANGVLKTEDTEAAYLCEHRFFWEGREYKRRELYIRVRLEPWGNGILPHEHTLSGPKLDRLNLIRACNANISPIYGLYNDPEGTAGKIIEKAIEAISKTSEQNIIKAEHWRDSSLTLYPIKDPSVLSDISTALADFTVYIADGHHRYETALAYRDELRANGGTNGHGSGSDYVLVALTSISDPGLVILPIHRLVRGLESSIIDGLKVRLAESFHLDPMPLKKSNASDDLRAALEYMKIGQEAAPVFLLYGLDKETIYAIQPEQLNQLRDSMPEVWPDPLKELDVSLLHWSIIEPMLGVPPEAITLGQHIDFTHSALEAVECVDSKKSQLAFLMSPTRVEQVLEVAQSGAKMPQKSTFFYPKLPTGLVINLLD